MLKNIHTKITGKIMLGVAAMIAGISPAFAHHPLGGGAPQTITDGLLSGVGHPIIGFDHLAFVIGIGILAAFFQKNRSAPIGGFIAGTIAGTALIIAGVTLPFAELAITASVVIVGLLAMNAKVAKPMTAAAIACFAGLFHGWAYGEAVIGAEATPIIAYVIGFAATQAIIALAAMRIAFYVMEGELSPNKLSPNKLSPRLAGAMIAGVGIAYLVEWGEALIFPIA